jgi:hypothetical protein
VLALSVAIGAAVAPVAAAENGDLYRAIGMLLGLRAYATGALHYCYDSVEANPDYTAAADSWLARNAEDLKTLDAAAASVQIDADTQSQMDKMAADKIRSDVSGAADSSAYCKTVLAAVNSGNNDMGVARPDELATVRAAAGK